MKIYLVERSEVEWNTILATYDNLQAAELHKALLEKERANCVLIPSDTFWEYMDDARIYSDDGTMTFKDYKGYSAEKWEKTFNYMFYNENKDGDFYVEERELLSECKFIPK